MVIKELDPLVGNGMLGRAGRAAEEQMAHYLRRSFGDDGQVLVFNGLRFERDGDAAQIDHLVLHPYGAVLIESKSVTTRISINVHGEWSRHFGRDRKGMPSPILQAERQADFLRGLLKKRADVLGDKELFISVRVAISDGGIIDRPRGLDLDALLKADQLPDEVRTIIQARKVLLAMPKVMAQMVAAMAGGRAGEALTAGELSRLHGFLLEQHRPWKPPVVGTAARPSAPAQPSAATAAPPPLACRRCGSAALSVEYGYSYYLKCSACGGSTAINQACGTCGDKQKVRKAGIQFYLDCASCGSSTPFVVNQTQI